MPFRWPCMHILFQRILSGFQHHMLSLAWKLYCRWHIRYVYSMYLRIYCIKWNMCWILMWPLSMRYLQRRLILMYLMSFQIIPCRRMLHLGEWILWKMGRRNWRMYLMLCRIRNQPIKQQRMYSLNCMIINTNFILIIFLLNQTSLFEALFIKLLIYNWFNILCLNYLLILLVYFLIYNL